MKRSIPFLVVVVMAGSVVFAAQASQRSKHHSVNISTDDEKALSDCDQIRMQIGDGDAVRAEQARTISASTISSLKVRATQNGGIHVQGWDRDEYSIKACIGAAAGTDLLSQIKLSVENGQVTVQGPASQDWVAYLIIQTPKGSSLDLSATNGPIGLNDVSGTIEAHNVNGPLTLHSVTGKVKAEVQNGPITVAGGGGDYRLSVQNGPLTVVLADGEWTGGELEGRTQNGPLTLDLAEGFRSSIIVDASKHSPVTCVAGPCRQAVRTWDQPNVIRFGEQTPVVRLSTVNGPVTLTSGEGKR